MPSVRQTPHRPQREEALRSQESAELKRQNRVLKRQIARLTKENEKLRAVPESEPEESLAKETPVVGYSCTACGSPKIRDVHLPTGVLRVCTECGARSKI